MFFFNVYILIMLESVGTMTLPFGPSQDKPNN